MKKIILFLSALIFLLCAAVSVNASNLSELMNTIEKRDAYFEVYGQETKAPVSTSEAGEERILTSEGSLSLSATDLYLPGKAGLDLNITRKYNSNEMYDEEEGYIYLHSIGNQNVSEYHESVNYVYQYYIEGDEEKTPVYIAFEDEEEMLNMENDGKIYTSSNYTENLISDWYVGENYYYFAVANTGTSAFTFRDRFYYAKGLPEGNDVVLVRDRLLTPDELWLYTVRCYKYTTYNNTSKVRINDGWTIEYPDFHVFKKEIKLVGLDLSDKVDNEINMQANPKNKRVHLFGGFSDPETGIMLDFSIIYKDRTEVEDRDSSSFSIVQQKIGILRDCTGSMYESDMYTIEMTKSYYEVDLNNEDDYNIVVTRYDGVKFYFVSHGTERIVKKEDRFGNTIKYLGWSGGRSGFIDTYGRTVEYEYTKGRISAIKVDGEVYVKYENSFANDNAKDPYNRFSSDNIHTFKVTKGFNDIENNTVTYKGRFRFNTWNLGSDVNGKGAVPTFSGLTFNIDEITLPTGAKIKYNYEEKKYVIPRQEGLSRDRIRVVSREYYLENSSEPVNKLTYTYDQSDMRNRVAATYKDGTDYVYKEIYNRKSQLIKTEETVAGGMKETSYTYTTMLEKNELPESVTVKMYNNDKKINPITTMVTYEYNSCQQPTLESNGLQTKTTRYGSYGIKIYENVLQDADKSVTNSYTLSSNKKLVQRVNVISTTQSNSTSVTHESIDYYYNAYGEVTKSVHNGATDEEDRTTEITYEYLPFDDTNPNKDVLIKTTTTKNVTGISKDEAVDVSVIEYYNYFGNVYKTVDGNGEAITVIYDSLQRPIKKIYPDNTEETITYNILTNDMTVTDKNGTANTVDYDGLGREKAVYIDGILVSSSSYTPHSELAEKSVYTDSDTPKSIVKYEYYMDGQPKSEKIYEGEKLLSSASYSYNPAYSSTLSLKTANIVQNDSQTLTVQQYSDRFGRVVKEQLGSDLQSEATYDIMGNVTSQTDYNGNTTSYIYDYKNRLIQTTDADGNSDYTTYNTFGEPIENIDKNGNKTTVVYNSMGKEIEIISPLLTVTKYYYDKNGNLTEQQIQSNLDGAEESFNYTQTVYDSMNRPVFVIRKGETLDNAVKYVYDNNGNVLRVVTGLTGIGEEVNPQLHQITSYEYNELNKPVKITYPDGLAVTNSYDRVGNLISSIDKSGTVRSYTYDGLGQLTDVLASDTEKEEKISYAFDLMGNVVSMTDSSGTTNYTYDKTGLLKKEQKDHIQKNYSYDNNGNRTGFVLNVGAACELNTAYTYDKLNRLISVSENGVTASYTYDKSGRLTKEITNGVATSYTYDANGRITGKTNKYGGKTDEYSVSYFADGNQASISETGKPTMSYAYDSLGRLTKETAEGESVTTYSYDNFQNRTSKTVSDINGNVISQTEYTYNMGNQLLNQTEITADKKIINNFNYDADGNTVSKNVGSVDNVLDEQLVSLSTDFGDSYSFEYDPLNRLSNVNHKEYEVSYTYDGNGLRQSKTVNGVTTSHIYDGQNIVKDGNQVFIRGINLIARNDNGSREYYAFNVHGDTTKLVNASGTILKDYSYDAFGNQKKLNETDTNPFRYSGEYQDLCSGLIYLRNRYYDSNTGRFISEDPARDGLNWYIYCGNNPINFVDPLGFVYVPLRDTTEMFNGSISWDYNTKTANTVIGNTSVLYYSGDGKGTFIGQDNKMYVWDETFYNDFSNSGNNRIAAVSYALSHDGENEINSDYRYFGEYGDCTNFVSQCLLAGGFQENESWYYRWGYSYSNTWTCASDLYNYAKNNMSNGTVFVRKANPDNLNFSIANRGIRPGDILGFQDEIHDGAIYHMVIITSIDGYGNFYYSGHSRFRENYELKKSIADGNQNLYFLRINY